jgi:hypothetical protein
MAIIDFAIVSALPEEFRLLRERFPDAREVSENFTWYRTRAEFRQVLLSLFQGSWEQEGRRSGAVRRFACYASAKLGRVNTN